MQETYSEELREVANRAWRSGISIQGDWARANAMSVAMAASLGLITTREDKVTFTNIWRITGKGLRFLNETKDI